MIKRLDLDWLRGIAAFFVVLSHLLFFTVTSPLRSVLWRSVEPFFDGGHAGVELFFVLSGFLIPISWVSCQKDFKTYFVRRAKRILPLFWFVCISLFIIFIPLFYPEWSYLSHWIVIPIHFLGLQSLIPIVSPGLVIIGPIWTLTIEISFYLILPFIWEKFNKHTTDSLLIAFFIALTWRLACNLFISNQNILPFIYMPLQLPGQLFEFACGMLVAKIWLKRNDLSTCFNKKNIYGNFSRSLSLLAFLIIIYIYNFNSFGLMYIPASIVSAWLIYTTIFFTASGFSRTYLFIKYLLSKLGIISYSVYLWHVPVIFVINRFFDLSFLEFCITSIFFTLIISSLSWRYIEKPFMH